MYANRCVQALLVVEARNVITTRVLIKITKTLTPGRALIQFRSFLMHALLQFFLCISTF